MTSIDNLDLHLAFPVAALPLALTLSLSVSQIMAGVDTEFQGESRLSDWAKVGYLEQEPKLDDGDTVASNIEAAVVPTRTLLKEYEQVTGATATATAAQPSRTLEIPQFVTDMQQAR